MKTEATRKEFSACELWKRSENSYAIRQRMELSKIKWEKEESKITCMNYLNFHQLEATIGNIFKNRSSYVLFYILLFLLTIHR